MERKKTTNKKINCRIKKDSPARKVFSPKKAASKKLPSFFVSILVKIKGFLNFNFSKKQKKISKRRFVIKQHSLEDFLFKHEAQSESYGEKYWKRYYFLVWLKKIRKAIVKILLLIRAASWRFSVSLGALLVIFSVLPSVLSAPHSFVVDTRAQWEAGTQTDTNTLSSTDSLQLTSTGSWTARTWAVPPDAISSGSSSIFVGNDLYVMRGLSDKAFWKYDSTLNEWRELQDLPFPVYHGADMVADNTSGLIYVIFGGYSKKFYSYEIATDSWNALPDLLDTIWTGGSIGFDGTNPYVMRGNSSTDFWRFNVSLGEWQSLAPVLATVSAGANLVYGYDGNFYTPRGANTLTFYRYNIATNTWSLKTNITTGYNFNGSQKGAYSNGYIYYARAAGTNGFLRYNVLGNSWDVLASTPAVTTDCSIAFNANDNLLYFLRSAGTYDLWKFDSTIGTTGDWVGPQQVVNNTISMGTGSDLIWNGVSGSGSYIYAVRGGTRNFYRYETASNSWTAMSDLPETITYDTTCTINADYIYCPRGVNGRVFYRYTISSNLWEIMTQTLATIGNGGSSAYNASTSKIYLLRGNVSSTFYSTDSNVSSWTTLAPVIVDGVTYNVNTGGRLVSDGNDLYATVGDGETAFLKYNTVGNSWSKLSATPFSQYYGTSLTFANGKIYALAGYYKDETWEYDIIANSWRMLPSNQKYLYGRGPYNGASLEYAGGNSFYALTGLSTTDMWSFTSGNENFISSGNYLSQPLDISQATNWVSFVANDDKPANTNVVYETRTSTDASSWSDWEAVIDTTISSPAQRYIQVRITLSTSDGVSTPTVGDYTITYNNSDTPPGNPTSVNAFSQSSGGTTLTSGQTYLFEHPYFNFLGASSPEAGVAGYYVYFGTDAEADPVSEGSFQETTSYEANVAFEAATYYLRC